MLVQPPSWGPELVRTLAGCNRRSILSRSLSCAAVVSEVGVDRQSVDVEIMVLKACAGTKMFEFRNCSAVHTDVFGRFASVELVCNA